MINVGGDYPLVCEPEEQARLRDDVAYREATFEKIIGEQLRDWCELARERLDERVRCIITPGNDDPRSIDGVLASQAPRIECPELAVAEVGPVWLASLGNTNRTPWDTEREYDEEELTAQIDAMVAGYVDGRPLVFNFHCPPHDSGLDTAAMLDDDLRPVVEHGTILTGPVGSTAVRAAVERYEPVVGLHGHIHESRGTTNIGRSLCLNPGSDYGSGVLMGALVDFTDEGACCGHLLTVG
jgi:Icc-related predicted phosphoesterase